MRTNDCSANSFPSHGGSAERERSRIVELLGRAQHSLTSGAIAAGMQRLAEGLLDCRAVSTASNAAGWQAVARGVCRNHDILATLLLDPFTARSFYKPHGYPGDAVLLDLIYGFGERDALLSGVPEVGRLIYEYSSNRVAPNAVRWRCQHVAQRIDELAKWRGPCRILSIASGHARELKHSRAAHAGGISEFVALDADQRTLDALSRECYGVQITRIPVNVKTLLRRSQDLGTFDLVYSLGLYDYLSDRTASRLLATMAKLVSDGGQALVANFSPGLPDAGYMEAFMDWRLCYRDEQNLRALARNAGLDCFQTYSDPSGCLALLTWARPS